MHEQQTMEPCISKLDIEVDSYHRLVVSSSSSLFEKTY